MRIFSARAFEAPSSSGRMRRSHSSKVRNSLRQVAKLRRTGIVPAALAAGASDPADKAAGTGAARLSNSTASCSNNVVFPAPGSPITSKRPFARSNIWPISRPTSSSWRVKFCAVSSEVPFVEAVMRRLTGNRPLPRLKHHRLVPQLPKIHGRDRRNPWLGHVHPVNRIHRRHRRFVVGYYDEL